MCVVAWYLCLSTWFQFVLEKSEEEVPQVRYIVSREAVKFEMHPREERNGMRKHFHNFDIHFIALN